MTSGSQVVDGDFEYSHSSQMAVPEFTQYRAILGRLNFFSATALSDISGLRNLEHLGQLNVSYTPLRNLEGLGGLRVITDNLSIGRLPTLTSLEGLGQLQAIGGNLLIFGNEHLTSLRGLSGLCRVGGNVQITDNPMLPQSEIDAFLDRIEVGGEVTVTNPGP